MRLIPRNSLLRWVLGLGLPILLFFGVFAGLRWKAYRDSANALKAIEAKLDAEDPGWRFEEMQANKPPMPDDRNSFTIIAKSIAELEAKRPKFPTDQDPAPNFAAERVLPEVLQWEAADWCGQFLAERTLALKHAREIAQFPEGRHAIAWKPDFISTPLQSVQQCREIAQLLFIDANVQAQFGDFNAAFDDLLALRNLARSLGKEDGTIIVMLVRIAINTILSDAVKGVLATGEADPKRLAELQAMIEEDLKTNILRDAFRVERGGATAVFNSFMRDPGQLNIKDTKEFMAQFRYSPYKLADLAAYLEQMTDAVAVADDPPERLVASLRAVAAKLPDDKETARKRLFTRLMIPSVGGMGETYLRWRAIMQTTAAALAVERFRLAEKRWPTKWDELVPAYMSQVPTDPFTGMTLGYAKTEDGVTVYSVGKDGQDNGGDVMPNRRIRQLVQEPDFGLPGEPAPPPAPKPKDPEWEIIIDELKPTDLGIRLWNPEARRKSPPIIEVKEPAEGIR